MPRTIIILVISLILQACGGNTLEYHPTDYVTWHPVYYCDPTDKDCTVPDMSGMYICKVADSILFWCKDNTFAVSPDEIPHDAWISIQWVNQQGFIGAVCEIEPANFQFGYCWQLWGLFHQVILKITPFGFINHERRAANNPSLYIRCNTSNHNRRLSLA